MRTLSFAGLLILASALPLLSACAVFQPTDRNTQTCEIPRNSMVSFEIYFSHGSATIDQSERMVVDRLTSDIKRYKPKIILITGHTDLSGPQAYNQTLAKKRAQRVARTLVKRNVSPDLIKTLSCGESDPSIPTQDNVKFLENRRVVVHLLK